ncbi:MAG: FAD-dependent monooxygenase [Nocardiaceae bacterium]|nr:FAD-dependent monooxygenase [Nocardiaceae bacterium]
MQAETVDVVIVGSRCAGTAMAAPLARAGRTVVVLDRAAFPADTLSTHVLFPMGVNEVARIGALDRILALNPSLMTHLRVDFIGASRTERFQQVGDIDYGISVPRVLQDQALVDAAREAGADIRDQCTVQNVIVEDGRAVGVRYFDSTGTVREIRARLVVGADGRNSTVAHHVGAWEPYRRSRNGRGMVFRYLDDPAADSDWAHTLWEGRSHDTIAFAFPCTPKGRLLVLFMGPRAEVAEARQDPEAHWSRKVAAFPILAERLVGATNQSRVMATSQTHAYFRRSSGPGWALIGDAGHFKDPVLGQGMRDAMWMGRTLAERVIDVLDDPTALDRATRRWERARDLEVLPTYHYGNLETRIPAVPPEIIAAVVGGVAGAELSDIHQRLIKPHGVYTVSRVVRAGVMTLFQRGPHPRLVLQLAKLFGVETAVRAELLTAKAFGGRMPHLGQLVGEHPDEQPWGRPPVTPAPRASAPKPVRAVVTRIDQISPDVRALTLAPADGTRWPAWTPGSHVDLGLPSGAIRQYSLCGPQEDRTTVRVAVLREDDGRGGSVEVHRLQEGAHVTVSEPRNNFELHPAAEYLFIAGGIGITPILPMIEQVEALGLPWRLHHVARTADRLPFGEDLVARYGGKVTLRSDDVDGRPDLAGWIEGLASGTAVYCCGPEGLMNRVVDLCESRTDLTVHIERFVPTKKNSADDRPFEVALAQSKATVVVPAGMSMLDALRNVVPVSASCENGLCGSCELSVLKGRPDHRDDILHGPDRDRTDLIYPCVSRSHSAKLTVDA